MADDNRPVKPANKFVDHGLGLLLFALIGRFLSWAATQEGMLLQWGLALAGTLVGINVFGHVASAAGQYISNARAGAGIPVDCQRPLAGKVAQRKWKDQSWQLAIHVSMSLWEVRLLAAQGGGWWDDPATCFAPCPATLVAEYEGGGSTWELRLFYVVQLALWMWTGVSCKLFEERRKDYMEMMAHHVMTVALVLNSLMNAELPIGLVVLAVHDTSDVFLDLMKMANYLKVEGRHGFFITEACFVLNTAVTWPYMRLYRFPAFVVQSVVFGYHRLCTTNGHAGDPWANPTPDIPGSWASSAALLTGLFLLHVFWWGLMIRIAVKLVMGEKSHEAGDAVYEGSMQRSTLAAGTRGTRGGKGKKLA